MYQTDSKMMRTIRLTENELNELINESVRRIIDEGFEDTMAFDGRPSRWPELDRQHEIDKIANSPEGYPKYMLFTIKNDLADALRRTFKKMEYDIHIGSKHPLYNSYCELSSKCNDLYNFLMNAKEFDI